MEKKFSRGLVLGKFMPPHNGHLHLINTASEHCKTLFVLICSLPNEPIDGSLRYNWLKSIYADNNNVKIIHVDDELPQHPEECSSVDVFYNDFWVPTVKANVGELDVVFTSETYGDEFAGYLGINHVLVDIERKTYPISGTKVRNNPYENWDFIPEQVKLYYTRRIAVMGPESTGKSVLVERLAKELNALSIPEFGREYVESLPKGMTLKTSDFYYIALIHNQRLLDKQSELRNQYLIADTEAITTKLFGQMYVDGYEDARVDKIIDNQNFDLYLLMDIDVPWVDDGTRDFPKWEDRKRHFKMIRNELERLGKNYVVIGGDYQERFEEAKMEIEKLGYL